MDMYSNIFENAHKANIKYMLFTSKLLVFLFFSFCLCFPEEYSTYNLKLRLSCRVFCPTYLQLALEWAVFPVCIRVLIVF